MPIFEYTALNGAGKKMKGSIDADNSRAARQRLKTQNIFPVEIKEGKAAQSKDSPQPKWKVSFEWVSTKNLASMTTQLSTLVGAGIPLVEALAAVSEQTEHALFKRTLSSVRDQVEAGSSLAKALGEYPKIFPRLYVNLVASGEASGTLDTVLENLSNYLDANLELRREITSSLFYPALLLVFSILVVIGLLTFVVPTVVEIFQKQGAVLPIPTRILIWLSDFLASKWFFILAFLVALVVFARGYYKSPEGRSKVDRVLLRAPIIGPIYQKICAAQVSRTLGALLTGGVGLLTALDIVKNIVGNVHVSQALEDARDGVREGRSLARELSRSKVFPSMLSQMVSVGERSGTLDVMLNRAGKAYEKEVNASLSGFTSLIEPLMIIGLGGIVLSIVIAILLPMVNLMDVIQVG